MGKYGGFTDVELRRPQRSMFDMSHDKRLTCNFGELIPFMTMEAIPGDTWRMNTKMLVRLLALLAPVYASIRVKVEVFFVPMRLLWTEWGNFITQGRLGTEVSPIPPWAYVATILTEGQNYLAESSLADYLGVPTVLDSSVATWAGNRQLDVAPWLAYQLLYMEYYRNRNFVADNLITIPVASGQINGTLYDEIFKKRLRGWSKNDPFVSALPFTQRGNEVLIPMEGTVTYLTQSNIKRLDGSDTDGIVWITGETFIKSAAAAAAGGSSAARIENIDTIENATVTINDFRSALALQSWMERQAVAGSRVTETIQAHFGVKPQDYRLQRPEYIGGAILPVKISEVVNTAFSQNEAAETIPAGNLAGHGYSMGNSTGFSYYCSEWGFIMGIMTIMPDASYKQGLPRMFVRRSFLDYPWPALARLGEQEVNNWELYMTPTSLLPNADGEFPLFGYQSRYADWKYILNTTHGAFRSTLDFWTLTRTFSSQPVLGSTFVTYDAGLEDNIFAVSGQQNVVIYLRNTCSVVRALPYYATPSNL